MEHLYVVKYFKRFIVELPAEEGPDEFSVFSGSKDECNYVANRMNEAKAASSEFVDMLDNKVKTLASRIDRHN